MDAKQFGKYLQQLRKSKKMTIRQLELYSGVSNAYLSLLENGKRGIPSPEILKKISKPLGVSYLTLMQKAGHINDGSDFNKVLSEEQENRDFEDAVKKIEAIANKYGMELNDPKFLEIIDKSLEIAQIIKNQK